MDSRDNRGTDPADEAIRHGDRKLQTACEEGIITIASERFFAGLALLYLSVQQNYPVPIVCFDGGLTERQKFWALENMPACSVRPVPDTEDIRRVRRELQGTSKNLTAEWLLWICPMLLASSPFRRTLWLDSDLVVLRRLGELFQRIDDGPVFTSENHDRQHTANPAELYDLLPIERQFDREVPLVNAGVSGWDLERDADVLAWYRYPVLCAARDAAVRSAISWHDQGSLIWALQKTGNESRVLESYDWNLCAKHGDNPKQAYSAHAGLLDALQENYPSANIVHWNGFQLPEKLAAQLGSEPDVLAVLRSILPGDGHLATHRSGRRRIQLISHIGAKAGLWLIERFLDHYARLGVDRFLIVLQGEEGDPRLDEARRALAALGIRPVIETPIYSAKLKHWRTIEMLDKQCDPDDWVLCADVDEFQIYPEELRHFLSHCDQLGYTFVRGHFIDRIAERGQLPSILPNGTLWAQFPYSASVTTQLSGGWTQKVCAMRGSMRLADGGSHGLDYGVDKRRNYATTFRDTHGCPVPIEVHHFKWDANLIQRIEEKILGIGGDRDATDGSEFMHEYRFLLAHIKRHGHLEVEGVRYLGEPVLHYARGSIDTAASPAV